MVLQAIGRRFDPGHLHYVCTGAEILKQVIVPAQPVPIDPFFDNFILVRRSKPSIFDRTTQGFRSSYQGHMGNALARAGDEGRGKLR